MRFRAFKYFAPLIIFVPALKAFTSTGFWCWMPLLYPWIVIPTLEALIPANRKNLSEAEEELAKNDRTYDVILYLVVVCQFTALIIFLNSFTQPGLSNWDIAGRITAMGMLCGTMGINVGHELGHRNKGFEQFLAKASLMTSMYMHFFIEHNKGHHKNVATPNDPSSARYNESIYLFWPRTLLFTYLSAWHIANDEMKKKEKSLFSLKNEMLQIHFIQFLFIGTVLSVFGPNILLFYFCSAFMGMLLLESVNYIEHY